MKKMKLVWLMVLLGVSLLPVAALAAAPHIGIGGLTGPFITCSGNPIQTEAATGQKIPPCTSLCDVVSTFQNILYFAVNLALFVLAPIMFIYGAVQVFMGAANESLISKGKSIILDTVIGLVIVFASFAIINTFFYLLGTKLGSGDGNVSWPNISCNGKSLPGYVDPSFYNKLNIPGQVVNPTTPTSTSGNANDNLTQAGCQAAAGKVCTFDSTKQIWVPDNSTSFAAKCSPACSASQVCAPVSQSLAGTVYGCKDISSAPVGTTVECKGPWGNSYKPALMCSSPRKCVPDNDIGGGAQRCQ